MLLAAGITGSAWGATKIKSAVLAEDNSIILETKGPINFNQYQVNSNNTESNNYVLELDASSLKKKARRTLINADVEVNFEEEKLYSKNIFRPKKQVKIHITSKQDLNFKTQELEKNKYKIVFQPKAKRTIHQLSAQTNEVAFLKSSQGNTQADRFVDGLDATAVKDLSTETFQQLKAQKIDSSNLKLMGDQLIATGHYQDGLIAYRKALKINPDNLNARLALAENSDNQKEKLRNYIKTFDTDALVQVSDAWMRAGKKAHSTKIIAAALVPLEYAVLKNPIDAQLRSQYARALEEAGEDYYPTASKRHLEAAAIFKKQYLDGDRDSEFGLRESLESAIRLLTWQGNFKKASNYCKSYRKLGFKKFLAGDPVKAIKRSIDKGRNPFRLS